MKLSPQFFSCRHQCKLYFALHVRKFANYICLEYIMPVWIIAIMCRTVLYYVYTDYISLCIFSFSVFMYNCRVFIHCMQRCYECMLFCMYIYIEVWVIYASCNSCVYVMCNIFHSCIEKELHFHLDSQVEIWYYIYFHKKKHKKLY